MSEFRAFTSAIKANPGDDTTRLVFADWLTERNSNAVWEAALAEHIGDPILRGRYATWLSDLGYKFVADQQRRMDQGYSVLLKLKRAPLPTPERSGREIYFRWNWNEDATWERHLFGNGNDISHPVVGSYIQECNVLPNTWWNLMVNRNWFRESILSAYNSAAAAFFNMPLVYKRRLLDLPSVEAVPA